MPPVLARLVSILTALSLLLLSSGAALVLHEGLAHAHSAAAVASADEAAPAHSAALPDAPAPTDHEPSEHRKDCSVCPALLHFAALATISVFLLDFSADATTPAANAVDAPELDIPTSPRSSRGPPLLA